MINTKLIINKLKPLEPQKIIVYGSYVKGGVRPESDIDLLIIKKTKKKPSDRIAEVLKLVWGHVPHIEPQVLTPEEFSQAVPKIDFLLPKKF